MTLTQLFTAIADAIRSKKGTSATIAAEDFPSEIAEISTGHLNQEEYDEAQDDLDDILENTEAPSGTIDITKNGEYNVTEFEKANVNVESEYNAKMDNTMKLDLTAGFRSFITEIKEFDTSHMTTASSLFQYCINIKELPSLDFSNITTIMNCFNMCTSLISIPQLNTQNVGNMNYAFQGCTSLENVPILNTSKITKNWTSCFTNCPNLSNESLNNIMQMCINAISYTGTKTLKYIGLSQTQAETCMTLSNYQAFLDAGWVTGY